MRLAKGSGRFVVILLLSLSIIGSATPAFSQAQTPATPPAKVVDSQTIIDRAEELFRRGEEAFGKGLIDIARKMWDDALDVVLQSGISLRTDSKLDAYYRRLVERIHKYEAQPGDEHTLETHPEFA